MQAEEYNRRGKEMVDYITRYLTTIRERKVTPGPEVKPGYMRELLPDSAPTDPEDWDCIFGDIEKVIMPGVVHWQSPYMHAYYPALTSWPSMLGDMLADAINNIGFTWLLVSPPSSSITTQKAPGEEYCRQHQGTESLTEDLDTLVILQTGHSDQHRRTEVTAVCHSGDHGVCAFDDLSELGPVCAEEGLWLHVDAAYAGSAFLCPELRGPLGGIEYADSFAFNPSKWMMVHFDCTAFWVKDKVKLQQTFSVDPVYLRHENSDQATDFMHWQIPGVEMAKLLESLVRCDPNFDMPADRHLGLVVFCLKEGNALTQELLRRLTRSRTMYLVPADIDGKRIIRFTVTSQLTTSEDIIRDWDIIRKMAADLLAEAAEKQAVSKMEEQQSPVRKTVEKLSETNSDSGNHTTTAAEGLAASLMTRKPKEIEKAISDTEDEPLKTPKELETGQTQTSPNTGSKELEVGPTQTSPKTGSKELEADPTQASPETGSKELEADPTQTSPKTGPRELGTSLAQTSPKTGPRELGTSLAQTSPKTGPRELGTSLAQTSPKTGPRELGTSLAQTSPKTGPRELGTSLAQTSPKTGPRELGTSLAQTSPKTGPESLGPAWPRPAPRQDPESLGPAWPRPAPRQDPESLGPAWPRPAPRQDPESLGPAWPRPAPRQDPESLGPAWPRPARIQRKEPETALRRSPVLLPSEFRGSNHSSAWTVIRLDLDHNHHSGWIKKSLGLRTGRGGHPSPSGLFQIPEWPSPTNSNQLGKRVLRKLTKFYSLPSFCHLWVQCGHYQITANFPALL
uniref:uncharacterized protein LOC124035389 n=1 Tax=Oncorhynchus gorbuscha TaxID=8017 RepID=UPI001EAF0204|nr:uncharacterized protein LOC124035389 [Oncorhynchus gorbuscha]